MGSGAVASSYADVAGDHLDPGTGASWRSTFDGFAEPVPSLLHHGGDAYQALIEEVSPPAWSAHRVVLVGDAAHASSPNLAQGAAMAAEDALVLADMVADQPLDRALAGYEARRTPRVAWVQKQTHLRDRIRRLPPAVRRLSLRLAAARLFVTPYRPLRERP